MRRVSSTPHPLETGLRGHDGAFFLQSRESGNAAGEFTAGCGTAARAFCYVPKIPCDKEDNQWQILSFMSPTKILRLRCSSRPYLYSSTSGPRGAARAEP